MPNNARRTMRPVPASMMDDPEMLDFIAKFPFNNLQWFILEEDGTVLDVFPIAPIILPAQLTDRQN